MKAALVLSVREEKLLNKEHLADLPIPNISDFTPAPFRFSFDVLRKSQDPTDIAALLHVVC